MMADYVLSNGRLFLFAVLYCYDIFQPPLCKCNNILSTGGLFHLYSSFDAWIPMNGPCERHSDKPEAQKTQFVEPGKTIIQFLFTRSNARVFSQPLRRGELLHHLQEGSFTRAFPGGSPPLS